MLVYKDCSFMINPDHPNDRWLRNADFVIADDSELAEKINQLYPNFDFVLDGDGNLVDIVEIEPVITEEQINECKNKRIAESKNKLAEWLNVNPMKFTDGKYYSVTEEKQALLNSNLASYERATQAGIEYDLKWNSTGQPCEPWNYSDLLVLSLNIAAYVAPKVSMQQNYEIQIKNCTTIEEIDSIVIDYNGNGDNSETNS